MKLKTILKKIEKWSGSKCHSGKGQADPPIPLKRKRCHVYLLEINIIYQYLHYKSCHAYHTRSSNVYSQVLHIRKKCNSKEILGNHISSLKDYPKDKAFLKAHRRQDMIPPFSFKFRVQQAFRKFRKHKIGPMVGYVGGPGARFLP